MKPEKQIQRLREVVASYGADPQRWPRNERQALMELAAGYKQAPWMIEAEDLDALLGSDAGQTIDGPLVNAIVAKAAATRQMSSGDPGESGQVIDFASAISSSPGCGSDVPTGLVTSPDRRYGRLPEAAVLAASLLVGVWVGGSGIAETAISGISSEYVLTLQGQDEANMINALSGWTIAEEGDLL